MEPYAELMRLEKPIGSWLLFWPGAWGIAMAIHPELPCPKLIALFGIGSIVMRGAGCTINDIWDRKIDGLVERTRTRPLAAGRLTNLQAISWLGIQLVGGLTILLQLNKLSIGLGIAALIPVVIYPLMKRITYWPQLVLGLTFNWGAFMGWTAHAGSTNLHVMVPLYMGGICWTIVYDTIYALQDINDDVRIGVKSTAILFGRHAKKWITSFAIASVGAFMFAGYQNQMGVLYYVGIAGAAAHFGWQIWTLKHDYAKDCLKKFQSNRWLGGVIFMGIVCDTLHLKCANLVAGLLSPA